MNRSKKPVEVLSRVTGLSEADVREVFEEARENAKRLDACWGPHDFGDFEPGKRDYFCSNCGGRVHATARAWYVKGLEHASISRK